MLASIGSVIMFQCALNNSIGLLDKWVFFKNLCSFLKYSIANCNLIKEEEIKYKWNEKFQITVLMKYIP